MAGPALGRLRSQESAFVVYISETVIFSPGDVSAARALRPFYSIITSSGK
jgi:hypothetical protein